MFQDADGFLTQRSGECPPLKAANSQVESPHPRAPQAATSETTPSQNHLFPKAAPALYLTFPKHIRVHVWDAL